MKRSGETVDRGHRMADLPLLAEDFLKKVYGEGVREKCSGKKNWRKRLFFPIIVLGESRPSIPRLAPEVPAAGRPEAFLVYVRV